MPEHKTQAQCLLDKTGEDGLQIGKWAREHSDTQIWCTLCCKGVTIDHGGISQVNQHIRPGSKHHEKASARFSTSQPKFEKFDNDGVKFVKKPSLGYLMLLENQLNWIKIVNVR